MLAKTSDDYTPCVLVYPHGKIEKRNILRDRLDTLEEAKRKLASDYAARLSYEDYERLQAEMQR